jgi:primosomal protein N' (replication factor Y)
MEIKTQFIDVIIPQAIPGLLTYRVPRVTEFQIQVGQRVVVPLGKSKLLAGIVRRVHYSAPANYSAKYVESILDEIPVIHEQQLLFWEWIADYYCCTIGEVMNAALPAGLKLSSETKFALNGEFEDQQWSQHEEIVINAMRARGRMTLQDVSEVLELKNVMPILRDLIRKGIITSEEEIREKFKPKLVEYLKLGSASNTEENLQRVFSELEKRKAQKQSDALMVFLRLSEWDQGKSSEVERLKLQKENIQSSTVSAMVEKGIFEVTTKEIGRLPKHLLASDKPKQLSNAQQQAFDSIEKNWLERDVSLLHGVTSSGKTEIYAALIERALANNKQVLFLLPEIALTTQIIHRLRKFFGKRVGVYHSGYSDNERTEVWQKVLSNVPGECDIILGARSSLFLPFSRLGLVIVDEEHEQSFKQHDPAPRYHARDAALWLAKSVDAKVLLGSATPSIESYWNALQNRYGLIPLTERFGAMELPEVVLCDLRIDIKAKTLKNNFTSQLLEEMKAAVDAGEQVILFQNRRGYSPLWECQTCGWIPTCTRCDVSLTYHKQAVLLKCHYCGYSTPPVNACHVCNSRDMKMLGFGTEKIEEDLEEFLPDVKVQRMDLDTTRSKSSYQKIISDFENGHTSILVGTQMVTKGLDFDNVSLVGILNADKMMNYPDFRSLERSFQIMTQVAGRAGRKKKRGRVLIQTYNPEHWLLDMVIKGDYKAFYEKEIKERYQFSYPPFIRLMKITIKHKEEEVAQRAASAISKLLRPQLTDRIVGPEKPYIPRINNYYLQQFMIRLDKRSESASLKHRIITQIREVLLHSEFKQVRLNIDVDPV